MSSQRTPDLARPLGEALATGVASGRTVVRYDLPPVGGAGRWPAWSYYDEADRLVIALSPRYRGNQLWSICLMLHEQAHHYPEIDPDPPVPPPPPGDPTPSMAAAACQEVDAECEAFYGLWLLFQSVGDLPVPCEFINHVRWRWTALWEICHGQFSLGERCTGLDLLLHLC